MDFLYRHMARILLALILVSGVAVLLFAFDLQRTLRTNHVKPIPVRSEKTSDGVLETPTLKPRDHYELIAKRDLFEFPEGTEIDLGSKGSGDQEAVESALDVQLKGTMVSDGGFLMAMIEDWTQRKEDLYMVGDSIQDAEIVKILKDRVILERAGRKETLTLFSDQKSKGRRGRPSETGSAARARPTPRPSDRQPPSAASANERQAQQRVRSLMAQLRLRPHFREGKPAGFVVGQVQPRSIFEESGLQKGDIIVAINDEDVITPNQLLKAYREVAEDEMLWMDILRNGEEEDTVEIDLEEIGPSE